MENYPTAWRRVKRRKSPPFSSKIAANCEENRGFELLLVRRILQHSNRLVVRPVLEISLVLQRHGAYS